MFSTRAHDEALGLGSFDHDRRYLRLTKHPERFKTAFPADEVVAHGPRAGAAAYGDRSLQTDRLDIADDLPMNPFVAGSRIEDIDPCNRDHLDLLGHGRRHQAASVMVSGLKNS